VNEEMKQHLKKLNFSLIASAVGPSLSIQAAVSVVVGPYCSLLNYIVVDVHIVVLLGK